MIRFYSFSRTHTFQFSAFLLLIAAILASGAGAFSGHHGSQPQGDPQKSISVVSELVAVPVNVTDPHGNFVPGLTKEDFRIFENDHPREIQTFEQEDTPVAIGLLVDHSGSMGTKLRDVATAISSFAQSSDSRDEMFVVDFGDDVRLQLANGKAFTNSASEIENSILGVSARGQTALYDAIAAGLDHLQFAHWPKKALIIVSDGGDNASRYKYGQILQSARASQVVIYSVGLVDEAGEEENPKILEQLCHDTGGIAFFPHSTAEIMEATAHIARDLRAQYMLGFVPENRADAGTFHKIRVQVAAQGRGKLRVRSRAGYSSPRLEAEGKAQ